MSLRHALLGLLSDAPASGYDLSRAFEGDLGRYAWHAGHTRIYPELVRMADEGLVAVESTGPRGRKSYALTGDGLAELRRWLLDPPEQGAVRNETVLRMFLVQALEPGDARRYLEGVAEYCEAEVARLRPVMAELDEQEGTDALPFGRLAGEYGLRQYEAVAAWAAWSLDRLEASQGRDARDA
ncbi:PadR family transcriptional regulator [Actinomycetospora sp. OC33-EN08]|uniref:PadR family transcriptional regulator n=1 Tax=Actinomycetospora aurantiaca TaxID=3129233 RepID=A0ABU8MRZ9_9PSEU